MSDEGAPFDVELRRASGRTVVAPLGDVDVASAGRLDAAIREALATGPVLLDLSGATFMDSTGIRMLDGLLRDVRRDEEDLRVRRTIARPVLLVLELTGLAETLPYDDEEPPA